VKVVCINEKKEHVNEFSNDPMNMCFEHKTKMKVDHRIEDVVIVIYIK
jgi:hypothetical protein